MIHSSMKTTIDVSRVRQTCKFYLQANLLLRNFRHCSDQVNCVLFQTYCTNLYCCQLWFNSTKSSLKKLSISYNSVLRRLLGICKPYSASKMFATRGIPTRAYLRGGFKPPPKFSDFFLKSEGKEVERKKMRRDGRRGS